MFELAAGKPVRFLCHTGHAFSMLSLLNTQDSTTEAALWAAIRALQEKEALLRRRAEDAAMEGADAAQALAEAEGIARLVEDMRTMVADASEHTRAALAAE